MAVKTSPFTDHWSSRHADSKETVTFIQFSEALLSTLYYQTDVGSIPRGIDLPRQPFSQFFTNPNWRIKIEGCYWCRRMDHNIQGVCCSKKCLYLLYEWCIDRIKHLQRNRSVNFQAVLKRVKILTFVVLQSTKRCTEVHLKKN